MNSPRQRAAAAALVTPTDPGGGSCRKKRILPMASLEEASP